MLRWPGAWPLRLRTRGITEPGGLPAWLLAQGPRPKYHGPMVPSCSPQSRSREGPFATDATPSENDLIENRAFSLDAREWMLVRIAVLRRDLFRWSSQQTAHFQRRDRRAVYEADLATLQLFADKHLSRLERSLAAIDAGPHTGIRREREWVHPSRLREVGPADLPGLALWKTRAQCDDRVSTGLRRVVSDIPAHRWVAAKIEAVGRIARLIEAEIDRLLVRPELHERLRTARDGVRKARRRLDRCRRLSFLEGVPGDPPGGPLPPLLVYDPRYRVVAATLLAFERLAAPCTRGEVLGDVEDQEPWLYEQWCAAEVYLALRDAFGTPLRVSRLPRVSPIDPEEGESARERAWEAQFKTPVGEVILGGQQPLRRSDHGVGWAGLRPLAAWKLVPDMILVHRRGETLRVLVLDAKMKDARSVVGSREGRQADVYQLHAYRDGIVLDTPHRSDTKPIRPVEACVALVPWAEDSEVLPGLEEPTDALRAGIGAVRLDPEERGKPAAEGLRRLLRAFLEG